MVLELLPGTPGLQGEDGSVITLGLPGGERVAGGDNAPAGTPTGLQWSSGFMCQVRGTASVTKNEKKLYKKKDIFYVQKLEYKYLWNNICETQVLRIQQLH